MGGWDSWKEVQDNKIGGWLGEAKKLHEKEREEWKVWREEQAKRKAEKPEQAASGFKETDAIGGKCVGSKASEYPLYDIEFRPEQLILKKFIQECLYSETYTWKNVELGRLMWTAFDLGREYEKVKGEEDGK